MTIHTRRNSWLLDKHLIGILAKELKKKQLQLLCRFQKLQIGKISANPPHPHGCTVYP